ncbi:MAG: hypothetical protein CAK90_07340 [Spartobacteria bacterium AMD-G4]|nr:MAG: hypothetical protein CAK90_07340 [Spartobacteria bacterium AMD-G4]
MIFRLLVISATALFVSVIAVYANDPSGLFLKAYQNYQSGENMEKDGRVRDAMNSYASTVAILEQIRKEDPSWQEMVVNFRMRKAQQNIERLRVVIAAEPEKLPDYSDPLPTRGFEIDIPEPFVRTRPRQGGETAVKISAPPSNSDRQQIESLQRQIEEFKKSLSTEKKLSQKMEGELANSRMELAQADEAFKNIAKERDELQKKVGEPTDKKIAALSGRIATLEAENEVADENNARLVEKLKRAADYITGIKKVLAATDEDRRNVAGERNTALSRVKTLKDTSAEAKRLREQNASLQKEIAAQKSDLERLAKIESENETLAQKVAVSEKKLAEISNSGGLTKAESDGLRQELGLLQDRLDASRQNLAARDASVKSLSAQLDEATGELARLRLNPTPSEEQERLYSESQLLRQIVIRQITEQTERAQAVSDLENELQRLQVQSEALASSLGILSNPPPIVRKEEQIRLNEPILLLRAPQSDGDGLSLVAVKSDNPPQAKSSGGANELSEDSKKLVMEASELVRLRRFTDAEKKYQQVVDNDPSNHFALANLGVIQIELDKLSAAKVALEKSLSLNKDDVFVLVNLANVSCRQGRFDDAIELLRRAIPLDPKNEIAHNYLAIALGKKGDTAKAEESFRESLSLNPNYANAHFNLAVMYANSEPPSLQLAKRHYEKAKVLGAEPDLSLERRLSLIQPVP